MVIKKVFLPDIGNYKNVEVIDVLVNIGDFINEEDIIILLETGKASMEVPSLYSGKVVDIKVVVGNKVSEGDLLLFLELDENFCRSKKTLFDILVGDFMRRNKNLSIARSFKSRLLFGIKNFNLQNFISKKKIFSPILNRLSRLLDVT